MALFRRLMNELHEIDQRDERSRILMWAIDIGLRDGRENAIRTFLNTVILTAHFQAISIVDAAAGAPLWRWLLERVVVLVGSLRVEEIDRCYSLAGYESRASPS
ncbi:MAG: hypothetical protein HC869_19445, partial [Rhodospirillales bacterium]|nr:hypothetical protein [Rhodospirillales bacterium]